MWGGGAPPQNFFLLCDLEWRILVNSEVLNLKYVIILGEMFSLTSHKPKYWRGCVSGISGSKCNDDDDDDDDESMSYIRPLLQL